MSILSQILSPGFAALHAITSDACTIGGVAKTATFDAERFESVFDEMGQRDVVRRTCIIPRTQLVTAPEPRSRALPVVFDGKTYVISAVGSDALHYFLTLEKRT